MKQISLENLEPLNSGDRLFLSKSGSGYDYASINVDPDYRNTQSLFLIIVGYREASRVLILELLQNHESSLVKVDSRIYPIVFVFRHYLEIIMKDTLRYQRLLRREINDDEVGFTKLHSLLEIWRELTPYIKYFCELTSLQMIENLLDEFDHFDKGSYSFRYPFRSAKKKDDKIAPSLPVEGMTIDLYNLYTVMEKMIYFFEGVNGKSAADLDNR